MCDPQASDPATTACIGKATTKATDTLNKVCFGSPTAAPACYNGSPSPANAADG